MHRRCSAPHTGTGTVHHQKVSWLATFNQWWWSAGGGLPSNRAKVRPRCFSCGIYGIYAYVMRPCASSEKYQYGPTPFPLSQSPGLGKVHRLNCARLSYSWRLVTRSGLNRCGPVVFNRCWYNGARRRRTCNLYRFSSPGANRIQ